MNNSIPTKKDLEGTHKRVQPFVHRTPILTSRLINELVGSLLFFKCENFQKAGAFKMRGAINAIQQLTADQKSNGVVTHSSGNFAQAVSLAAKQLGVKAYIVMPSNAPKVKIEGVKTYGGEITFSEPNLASREREANRIQKETGATFLHPSNNLDVILGQGTSAIEFIEDQSNLDVILTPVGGGGLLAGTALACHYYHSTCKVIGGEPLQVNDAFRSLKSGKIEYNEHSNTIADGLRTHLGDINFPIITELVDEIICVSEEEIITAMKIIWERMKIIVEPSSAVPLAAILKEKKYFKGKNIGVILSGGNVDISKLPFNKD
ncbi:pyridoxal-phosphate dependent enzyme [Candidatus Marifrigoribacter sp. Uisw_064]|uniref:pyridoxal-phosphate dependent enzyme n=1 Tax=Candidatus Marifrigoribacter sp. Uisw_064 TaxID=3230970 RepID=UPI003D445A02